MSNNNAEQEQANLIPPVNNQNPDNNQNQPAPQGETFFDRISSKDVLVISIDLLPSTIFIGFILHALISTPSFCDKGFASILKALMFIYTAFILKALMHIILVYLNGIHTEASKISMSTMNFILNLCYYIAIVIGYVIYRNRPDDCFLTNTFPTILLFCLILIGIINLSRHVLNFFMIVLCFPIMVYYFLRNPQSFYSNFGIDPEIVRNLPTIKADAQHCTNCVICSEDIVEGDDILILRCPGRHYFHGNCIKSWLVVKVMCPMCRYENVL